MTIHSDLHLWGQLASMVITFILSYYLLITFFKIRKEMKDAVDNSNEIIKANKYELDNIIKSNKEELSNSINDNKKQFQEFITNVYNYNYINYDTITTRLFRDVILLDLLNQNNSNKEYISRICGLMYNANININQLKEYNRNNEFLIDSYQLYINEADNNKLLNNNEKLRNMIFGNNIKDDNKKVKNGTFLWVGDESPDGWRKIE